MKIFLALFVFLSSIYTNASESVQDIQAIIGYNKNPMDYLIGSNSTQPIEVIKDIAIDPRAHNTLRNIASSENGFADSESKNIYLDGKDEPIKILKDIEFDLDRPTHISKYCYIRPSLDYFIFDRTTNSLGPPNSLTWEDLKGKQLKLPTGKTYPLNFHWYEKGYLRRPILRAVDWVPRLIISRTPNVYLNHIGFLVAYDDPTINREQLGANREIYLGIQVICSSPRFKNPIIGDGIKKQNRIKKAYYEDVNYKMSSFIEFNSAAFFNSDDDKEIPE